MVRACWGHGRGGGCCFRLGTAAVRAVLAARMHVQCPCSTVWRAAEQRACIGHTVRAHANISPMPATKVYADFTLACLQGHLFDFPCKQTAYTREPLSTSNTRFRHLGKTLFSEDRVSRNDGFDFSFPFAI